MKLTRWVAETEIAAKTVKHESNYLFVKVNFKDSVQGANLND
ncbi:MULTISPECIES: hypothetical protein [unclassified Shewanella]|nr:MULTISPECIES: hypothetical protein [unclassified Shewanella]